MMNIEKNIARKISAIVSKSIVPLSFKPKFPFPITDLQFIPVQIVYVKKRIILIMLQLAQF